MKNRHLLRICLSILLFNLGTEMRSIKNKSPEALFNYHVDIHCGDGDIEFEIENIFLEITNLVSVDKLKVMTF